MRQDFRINKRKSPVVSLGIKNGDVKAKIHRSKASFSQKQRWDLAREKKSIWEKYNPESEFGLKEFYKNDNILDENIEVYDISVQVNYNSNKGGLKIDSQTFQVISLKGLESSNNLNTNIKSAYGNMIFSDTGDTFNPAFQSAIERETKITPDEIRGLEQTEKKLSSDDYTNLLNGRYIVKDLNQNLSATKNKKGNTSGSKFDVELDLSNFM